MRRNSSYYDIERLFLRSIVTRDIADPLIFFDSHTPAALASSAMEEQRIDIAGVSEQGRSIGYILRAELAEGECRQFAHSFQEAVVLPDSAPLIDLVKAFSDSPWVLVRLLGAVNGLVTRNDLQDPPVRMWLFGMITVIEMGFLDLIKKRYSDESWKRYLSPARIAKAAELLEERHRRNQYSSLLDCLQFSDKRQIVVRDEVLRQRAGFASRRRGDEAIKNLERLRNNLAHSQDIVSSDWDTIVALVNNLEKVIHLGNEG
jgi:hypothetical protein